MFNHLSKGPAQQLGPYFIVFIIKLVYDKFFALFHLNTLTSHAAFTISSAAVLVNTENN